MAMFVKLRSRRIFIFYMLILLADYIVLSQEEMNRRKTQSSTENSDNDIIVAFDNFDEFNEEYDENNLFNKGNRELVSYIKSSETTIRKEDLNQSFQFTTVDYGSPLEIEIHFSSCASSLERFFDCEDDDVIIMMIILKY